MPVHYGGPTPHVCPKHGYYETRACAWQHSGCPMCAVEQACEELRTDPVHQAALARLCLPVSGRAREEIPDHWMAL